MGNNPPSICMEARSLRRKHGEGVKTPSPQRISRYGNIAESAADLSLRQRGHQQYTRFCRVEGVGHQPGLAVIRRYDAAAGTGGSHHHDARLLRFLIPAALRTDTDPAPVPA